MRKKLRFLSATALTFLLTAPAYAAGSGMPWEEPLQRILESVQGPVAKIVAVIIIIVTGLTLAFGETSGGFRRLIQIVLDRKSTRLNSSHYCAARMPPSA